MVKCIMCPKRKLADDMMFYPVIDKKQYYTCSNECYEKYVEEWRNNLVNIAKKGELKKRG